MKPTTSYYNHKSLILLLVAGLLGILAIWHTIDSQDYLLFFVLSAFGLLLVLEKTRLFPIIFILVVTSCVGWAVPNYLPRQVMWAPELLSGLLMLKVFKDCRQQGRPFRVFGIKIWLVFTGIVILSAFYNNMAPISSLLFYRQLVRYYFLFLAIINMQLNEREQKIILYVIAAIFLVQLPLAGVKVFIFGQGEKPLGLNSHSTTTFIVLIAFSFLASFYLKWKSWYGFFILALCFTGFGIIGGKRGFIFLLPVLLAYLFWCAKRKGLSLVKIIALILLILPPSLYFSGRLIPTLNPNREIWGEFNSKYIVNYAIDYTTAVNSKGQSIGRTSATVDVFNKLKQQGGLYLLFGNGPGYILKSIFGNYSRKGEIVALTGVGYGVNGLNWLAIQVGYVGTFVFIYFFRRLQKVGIAAIKNEKSPFWRAFALGMMGFCFIMIFIALFYSAAYKNDALSAFFFCSAGVLYSRYEGITQRTRVYRNTEII